MPSIHAEASATINAGSEVVYGIIADYREGHPQILPQENFSDLQIEQGGVGAGTIISFTTKVAGTQRKYRMRIEEPEPGRVLAEKDLSSDVTTTFTITPLDGARSLVKIATDYSSSPGIMGLIERLASPGLLRKVYEAELRKLNEVASSHEPHKG